MDICVKEWIKNRLSFHSHPYLDNHGRVVIGYNRILDNMGVTKQEADLMLDNDINYLQNFLLKFSWYFSLPTTVKSAVLIMALEIGLPELLVLFSFIQALTDKDWTKASKLSIDSRWTDDYKNIIDVAVMIRECDENAQAA